MVKFNWLDRPMDLERARYWALAPAAIGGVIDALEALSRIDQYGEDGILRGRSAGRPSRFLPQRLLRHLDSAQGATALELVGLTGCALVLTGRRRRGQQIAGAGLMFAGKWLTEFRNPYGRDGSDQMSTLINGYRVLTAAVPGSDRSDDLFLRAVNAQTALSYVASGLAKMISSTWLSGDALDQVLRTQQYGGSWLAKTLRQHPRVGKAINWATVVGESAYPVIYFLSPKAARIALLGVKGFHLGIAGTMGLPRFFWGFASSHAAVSYVIESSRGAK